MLDMLTEVVVPSVCGAFIGFADLFMRGRTIPSFTGAVRRGDPLGHLALAFVFNVSYAIPIAHWLFSAADSKQHFLASLAAVAIVSSRSYSSRPVRER